MKKVRVELTGVTPLLMHSARLVNPMDPTVRAMKQITSKRKKTDDDVLRLARLEWEGGMYWQPGAGPYLPGGNLEACIRDAAKVTRHGTDVVRGVIVEDQVNPVGYDGPRDLEGLWGGGPGASPFVHQSAATVRRAKVIRTWAKFDRWRVEFTLVLNEQVLDYERLVDIVASAGLTTGLGDYRPTYGRFESAVSAL